MINAVEIFITRESARERKAVNDRMVHKLLLEIYLEFCEINVEVLGVK